MMCKYLWTSVRLRDGHAGRHIGGSSTNVPIVTPLPIRPLEDLPGPKMFPTCRRISFQKLLLLASDAPHHVVGALREPIVLDGCVRRRVFACPVTAREGVKIFAWVHGPVHRLQQAGGCSKHKPLSLHRNKNYMIGLFKPIKYRTNEL